MSLIKLKEKIKKTEIQIKKLKNQLVIDSEKLFNNCCVEIFKNNPEFTSFSWTQYTPYWNDGDPCNFYANTDYLYIDDEEEETDFHNTEIDVKELKQKEKTIKKLTAEIEKLKKQGKNENDWEITHKQNRIKKLNELNLQDVEKRLRFIEDIDDLLKSINQDVLENMFGDHVKVIVTADGAKTEHYEHD